MKPGDLIRIDPSSLLGRGIKDLCSGSERTQLDDLYIVRTLLPGAKLKFYPGISIMGEQHDHWNREAFQQADDRQQRSPVLIRESEALLF